MLKAQLKLKKQELKYLKMQINPHFLFNTLNSIYGFALQRADETPDLILRLSGLLDYMLYQIDKPEVPISLETEHLANYIELEKIRLEDSLDISHNFDMLNNECMVSPMLFIPFIENAFKHGRKVGNKLKVWIELRVDQKEINFNVKNTYHIQHESSQSGGLGLNNIRQRLKILYPDRHHLIIENNLQEQYFHINLTLQTSKTTSYELSY
ncbi:sensor histidine kinase [Aureibacter tunicatorum]|uniref:LytS/YehU family sensor histidine kinase n=1 Tax=Aureibacter tunicatorum TaxID=866807 RepID=A0AAE3XQ40_9BACT|nr:histidine kinase [Aureibacter tunicatorum]MDR6239881.1 LytS/YehU family sensor histidine kinase [Aureibacter tunicatorum]